jgi:hypothetical protein
VNYVSEVNERFVDQLAISTCLSLLISMGTSGVGVEKVGAVLGVLRIELWS